MMVLEKISNALRDEGCAVDAEVLPTAELTSRVIALLPTDVGRSGESGQPPEARGADSDAVVEDVRLLGALLGLVILEHGGRDLYLSIERVRVAARRSRRSAWRSGHEALRRALYEGRASRDTLEELARLDEIAGAFRLFLMLAGVAESVSSSRTSALGRTVSELVSAAKHSSPDALSSLRDELSSLRVRLVATAHPTMIMRRRVLEHRRDLLGLLQQLRQSANRLEQATCVARIVEKIEVLWATRFSRWEKPEVSDEIDHVLGYFHDVLYVSLGQLHEQLERLWTQCSGLDYPEPLQPRLTLGSWVGGDMDGNPFVTPTVFAEALGKQRDAVLELYARELEALAPKLSHSAERLPPTPELEASLRQDLRELGKTTGAVGALQRQLDREPLRLKLVLMARRAANSRGKVSLEHEGHRPEFVYACAAELERDLELVADCLREQGYHAALHESGLGMLRRRVALFGLHLATIDIREDAQNVRASAECVLRAAGLTASPDADEQFLQALTTEVLEPRSIHVRQTEGVAESEPDRARNLERLLGMLAVARRAHQSSSPISVQNLILSMTFSSVDVLAALLLAKVEGHFFRHSDGSHRSYLDIVPLFETIDALERAPDIMEELFSNVAYQAQLAARDSTQLVMLGYSDSNKDGGYVASNFATLRCQLRLMNVARTHGIRIRFFHGRGGSVGRGGGPARRAILALPRGVLKAGFEVTEQGEVLSRHYLSQDTAQGHLQNVIAAVWRKNAGPPLPLEAAWLTTAEELASLAQQAYAKLVHGHPHFVSYFERVTPREVELVKIGSRPAKRRAARSVRDLRAIPWVFRWFQARQLLPGWFGIGSAVHAWLAQEGRGAGAERTLREMYANWPFFRGMIENSEIALRQTDLRIARYYVEELAADSSSREILDEVAAEHERAVSAVTLITGRGLLDGPEDRDLERSIRLKEPYLDPLNYLQVALLKEYRQAQEGAAPSSSLEAFERAIVSSIEGIATGLGVTG